MSSRKLALDVLRHMKRSGNIVGATPGPRSQLNHSIKTRGEGHPLESAQRPRVLSLRSYNPLLSKEDFLQLLPQKVFSTESLPESLSAFEVVKVRDPRYFQFRDKYELVFPTFKAMKQYQVQVAYSRIDGVRPNFRTVPIANPQRPYAKYASNLSAAFQSREKFFETIHPTTAPAEFANLDLDELRRKIAPVEEKSLIVWNFPPDLRPYDITEKYWCYEIKHCFKLYWDTSTGKTLTYMAFNSAQDCSKFQRNFHGVYFNENDQCKLLVEALR